MTMIVLIFISSHSPLRSLSYQGWVVVGSGTGIGPAMGRRSVAADDKSSRGEKGGEESLRSLPSKRHSCSELQKGHKRLMDVKTERLDPEEMAKKIKDTMNNMFVVVFSQSYVLNHYYCFHLVPP